MSRTGRANLSRGSQFLRFDSAPRSHRGVPAGLASRCGCRGTVALPDRRGSWQVRARAQESHSVRDDEDVDPNTCSRSGGQSCVSRITAHGTGQTEEREEWHDGQQLFRPQQRPGGLGRHRLLGVLPVRSGQDRRMEVRTFSKPVWVLLLVFANVVGSLTWFAVGRPQRR